jgi:7,8-dihydro-6-hydroxymethylpterin-pyrophosphokinase
MKTCVKHVFFQKIYISVDFLEKKCEGSKNERCSPKFLDFDMILQNAEGVKKTNLLNPDVEQKLF